MIDLTTKREYERSDLDRSLDVICSFYGEECMQAVAAFVEGLADKAKHMVERRGEQNTGVPTIALAFHAPKFVADLNAVLKQREIDRVILEATEQEPWPPSDLVRYREEDPRGLRNYRWRFSEAHRPSSSETRRRDTDD